MVGPINSDKTLTQSTEQSRSNPKRTAAEPQTQARPANHGDDTLELSQASQMANQESGGVRSSGRVQSTEQAQNLVAEIRSQLQSSGQQALQLHRLAAGQMTNLLGAASA